MSRPTDVASLADVRTAAIIALVVGVVYGAFVVVDRTALGGTGAVTGTRVSLPPGWTVAVLLGIGLAIALAELFLLRRAFHRLAGVDGRFGTPSTLALLALISYPIAIVGAAALIDSLYRALACAGGATMIPAGCLPLGEFGVGIGLALIGGIVALVGWIGVLIGIWRLGTRYNDASFKAGAILLLFPFLDVVGSILILIAAHSKREQLGRSGPMFPPST